MRYLHKKQSVRITEDNEEMINNLMKFYPGRFENQSAVIRAAISYFYRKEVTNDGKPKNKDFQS